MGKKTTSPFSKEQLMPQAEMLEIKRKKGDLFIGVPKESYTQEKRVCLTPDAVAAITAHGHRVIVESGAGLGSNFSDIEYSESGAKIAFDPKEAFECNIVLKVGPPSYEEIEMMCPQSALFSTLQLKTQTKKYFESLAKKRISAVAFDFIRDEQGAYPVVKSLSEIAGIASVLIASEIMSSHKSGNGLLMGNISGVPPTNVVILGGGTVGEFAARSALGLGARVKVFDNSLSKLRHIQRSLGSLIYTSTIQPKTLQKALMRCDVAIGAMRGKTRSPILVSEEMVQNMKHGAVIVDVSIDSGGCFETSEVTSHQNPTFEKYGITHYCVPNIPSKYSRTSSVSITNIFTPYLLNIAEEGGFENAVRFNKMVSLCLFSIQAAL